MTSLATKQFNSLGDSKEPYFCNNCLHDIIPFQKLTHSEFADLYQIAQIEVNKEINHVLNSLDAHGTSEYVKAYEIKKSFYKANFISVIHANIRSLAKNFYQLEELLHEMQVQPDIIVVTETWLEPSRTKRVTLPGYNFFHTDALTASPNETGLAGGVGMYVKSSINATVRDQFRLELPGC